MSATRSWSLAGTGFVAGSMRWRPAAPGLLPEAEQVGIASVGVGLGLTPNKPGRGGARLDVAYPVLSPPGALRRPYVMISLSPWFQEGRRRAGITPR